MAGNELESFVRKFVNLWQSGCDAKLHVESEAGKAFITLRVGLGHDLLGHHHHVVSHRGGGPAKQRRKERREAERQAAEEVVVAEVKAEESFEVKVEETEVTEKVSRKQVRDLPIPQTDGVFEDGKAHFEVKVDAHEKCSNKDVIEAIKENFYGELDNRKVDNLDPVRHLMIREENEELIGRTPVKVQEKYTVVVREEDLATEIVGLWNKPYEFDDLAFKNAVYREIKIKEVKRVR